MSLHFPRNREAGEPPVLDWPEATGDLSGLAAELYWIPFKQEHEGPPQLQGLPLSPEGTPVDGLPPEGTVVKASVEAAYVPVWLVGDEKNWWAVDGTSGQVVSGRLQARPGPARGRLAFFSGLALFISFLGGSFLLWVLLMVMGTIAVAAPGGGVPLALGLAGGLTAVIWLLFRLAVMLPATLEEPVRRAQEGVIRLPLSREWDGLLHACGMLMGFSAFLGLVSCAANAATGQNLGGLLFGVLQAVLSGYLAWHSFKLARGRRLSGLSSAQLDGPLGELVLLGVRVTLFALAGQLIGGLFGSAVPTLEPARALVFGVQLGALIGVAVTPLSGHNQASLLAGLAANAAGNALLGPWAGLAAAVLAVSVPGLLAREAFLDTVRASWGFTLGLVVGKMVGRTFGLLFLGVGGLTVGEVLAEQVIGAWGLVSASHRQD